jgi:two-component system OmpR family response regulator
MAHRIFLLDDDRFLLDLYAAKFKSAGEGVEAFTSAEELLGTLRKSAAEHTPNPDAILVDLIMPGMDGFTFLETVKKEGLAKGAKLIILTNEGADAEIERARSLGIDGYIVKASAVPSEVLSEVIRTIGSSAPPPTP